LPWRQPLAAQGTVHLIRNSEFGIEEIFLPKVEKHLIKLYNNLFFERSEKITLTFCEAKYLTR